MLETLELPTTLADQAVATVERIVTSDLWRRANESPQRLTEAPLGAYVAPGDAPGNLPTVLRGVLDLVFREGAGWVIVDYKTERVEPRDIPALTAYYRPQLDAYAQAWANVVKQPVVERGLYFTHTSDYVTV
jgi:ATP-dependent helicase/nuclease subunit A